MAWYWLVLNAVVFQFSWFALLKFPLHYSMTAVCVCMFVHAYLISRFYGRQKYRELKWLLAVVCVGWCVETLFFFVGALEIESPSIRFGLVPVWLVCLWLGFATTFRFSMSFLTQKIYLTPFIGALVFTNYAAGAALSHEVTLGSNYAYSLGFIATVWALILPLLAIAYRTWVGSEV